METLFHLRFFPEVLFRLPRLPIEIVAHNPRPLPIVQYLVSQYPGWFWHEWGDMLLCKSVESGNTALFSLLLEQGRSTKTPASKTKWDLKIHDILRKLIKCTCPCEEIVNLILDQRVSPLFARSDAQHIVIDAAERNSHTRILKRLLSLYMQAAPTVYPYTDILDVYIHDSPYSISFRRNLLRELHNNRTIPRDQKDEFIRIFLASVNGFLNSDSPGDGEGAPVSAEQEVQATP